MLTIPKILDNPGFLTKEIIFKWDIEKSPDYFTYKVENEKLVNTLWKLNHKATLGLVAACSEWIFWRFSHSYDVKQALNAIEALWLGLIDKLYIINWKYNAPKKDTIYANIVWIIFNSHLYIRDNYIKGDYQIQYWVMNLIMLAHHVTSDQKMFDNWLNDCLKRSIELFPAQYDRGATLGKTVNGYDSSGELPIPREFYFEPGFDYNTANIDKLLSDYMKTVDYSNSSFFRDSEEMIEQGFEGTPYKYEPK